MARNRCSAILETLTDIGADGSIRVERETWSDGQPDVSGRQTKPMERYFAMLNRFVS